MVKKTIPIFNDTYDDEVELKPLKIKSEADIVHYYESCEDGTDLDLVYDATIEFKIDNKIEEYKNDIYTIYKNVVEEFVENEAPTHIFDTGLHNNLMVNFIDYVYYNSKKGYELEYVKEIENEYNIKLDEFEKKNNIKSLY